MTAETWVLAVVALVVALAVWEAWTKRNVHRPLWRRHHGRPARPPIGMEALDFGKFHKESRRAAPFGRPTGGSHLAAHSAAHRPGPDDPRSNEP